MKTIQKTALWFFGLTYLVRANLTIVDDGVHVSTIHPTGQYGTDGNWIVEEEFSPSLIDENNSESTNELNVVATIHGPVRGYVAEDTNILQFFDIPYAVFDENYPFQEPEEPESWQIIREITEHNSICPQLNFDDVYVGTTDCLTLSVFVPQGAENVDVLFHIHDSDFIHGSGDPRIYGPDYLVSKKVILVLPNYRLGPLGFLCLQNNTAPGNAALKDLFMALNWTKNNIENFGGNPANIVVSGSGTGAALSQYLALLPRTKVYISKVITETGCVLSHWAIDRNPLETAKELVKRLNNSSAEIAYSLFSSVFENSSLEETIRASNGLIFRPCVERTGILTDTPWNLLHNHKLNKTYMFGASDRPGLHKAMQYTEESVSALNDNLGLLLPNDLIFNESNEEEETGKRVKVQYFGNNTITLEHRNELSLCHSDCSYLSPGIRNARLLVEANSTVYFYEFAFVPDIEYKNNSLHRAVQGDSLNYIFQKEGHVFTEGTEEYEMKKLMTNLWVSFIQTGKPTSEGVEWEPLVKTDPTEEIWLSIGSTTEVKKGFHIDRLSLWSEIYNHHFIEHNIANKVKPRIFSATLVLLVQLFNYCHNY